MQRLELTWIGKGEDPAIEPRILLHDPSKDYGDPNSENMIIHGDNLLALKALEQQYAGQVKCIYIDPPFNTGARIDADGNDIGYDDGLEHSIWLNLMFMRFKVLKNLLSEEGTIIVQLDDREGFYCKIIMDEVFGRNNYINTITMTTNDPSGFKATGSKIFSTSNFMLIYGKNKTQSTINKVFIEKEYDTAYSKVFTKMDGDYKTWEWTSIKEFIALSKGFSSYREASKTISKIEYEHLVEEYALQNPSRVFRTAAIGGGAKIKRQLTIDLSKNTREEIFVHENEDVENFYILNGEQILFYSNRFELVNNKMVPSQSITDVWTDISWTGIASEGNVTFKNSKKPEQLIKRVLDIFSNENDLVLDSFLGSGTTASVAHKMGRRYIGIELGNHCYTHCIPRLQKVVDGEQGGISKIVGWQGGGGFKFYELAPTLIEIDKYGNPVFSKQYNSEMLVAAVAKINGFYYAPDSENFWKQGFSQDNSYIYVTTQYMTAAMLDGIASELSPMENLLICSPAFDIGLGKRYDNINVRKIPQSVLSKCEFGADNYNLNIVDAPVLDEEEWEDD